LTSGEIGPYFAKVKTIIQTNCTISCHSPQQGFYQGLPVILDTDSDIIIRSASIKTAVAGPFNFMTNKQMPLGGQLSGSDVNIISNWVEAGGKATD
jgi:uncharacterized membrane protein